MVAKQITWIPRETVEQIADECEEHIKPLFPTDEMADEIERLGITITVTNNNNYEREH